MRIPYLDLKLSQNLRDQNPIIFHPSFKTCFDTQRANELLMVFFPKEGSIPQFRPSLVTLRITLMQT
jgi:hypothetical protein